MKNINEFKYEKEEPENTKKIANQERLENGSIRFHNSILYEKEIEPIKKIDKVKE